ncbi:Nn.00g078010.m01.CDS01 [Neocucurbitaria sp. VM-36]
MRATFAIAALAGSALAAPYYGRPQKEVKNVHVVVETVVKTVYVTEGYKVPKPTPTPESVYETPAVTTVVYESPAPAPTSETSEAPAQPTYEAPAPEPTSEAPAPTTTTQAPAPAPTASGYQGIVDTWRAKMGMKALINDAKLESNAMDVVVSSNGQMVHKLNPGTFAQVLAPGTADNFEHVFVGGWLCEIPTLPGLDGVCATQSEGWSYQGQTGHAEILTSDSYSKIGCALHAGIWCCDLA